MSPSAPRKFILKEATRKRCNIVPLDAKAAKRFRKISLELYSYFSDADSIDFSLFFRNGNEMVEFIRAKELSEELLKHMWAATQIPDADVDVCVQVADFGKVQALINKIRDKKLKQVQEKDPTLDSKTLEVFGDLSAASQMIVKGGIDNNVARSASSAVQSMMAAQVSSDIAVGTLSRMIECDATLYDHSASVAMFSGIIASQHLPKPLEKVESELVARCGLYHDTGKTCVPNAILNKPGKFTDEEYEIMKQHTVLGHQELESVIANGAPIEEIVARVALEHHERFNGSGYPHKRKGRLEENPNGIHMYTRIVSIADVYSALLMKRVYKEAYSPIKAVNLMKGFAPTDFDPDIFDPFFAYVTRSIKVYEQKEEQLKDSRILMIDENESFAQAIKKK